MATYRYSRILQLTVPAVPLWAAFAVEENCEYPLGYFLDPVVSLALVETWTDTVDDDSEVPSASARHLARVIKPVTITDYIHFDVEGVDNFFLLVTDYPGTQREQLQALSRAHRAAAAARAAQRVREAT